jgi:hypothetical protein
MILSGILAYNCVCRKKTCDTIRTTCHHYPYHSFIGRPFLAERATDTSDTVLPGNMAY